MFIVLDFEKDGMLEVSLAYQQSSTESHTWGDNDPVNIEGKRCQATKQVRYGDSK